MTRSKTAFFCLLFLVYASGAVQGAPGKENVIDETRLSLHITDAPLKQAIQTLIQRTSLEIIYSDDLVQDVRVNCDLQDKTLREVLLTILRDTRVTFKALRDGQVILYARETPEKINLRGYVRDATTGETLPYANIRIKGSRYGTATNANGYFAFVGAPGWVNSLSVNFIGYQQAEHKISQTDFDDELTILLEPKPLVGDTVTVFSAEDFMMDADDAGGQTRLSPQKLNSLPALGDQDIFKSLNLLPGFSSHDGSSSSLRVQGGRSDENLVLFDGMTIYQVDHFFGLVSAFNSDIVKDVRVFTGGFPARYGGRTSSVIELTGKTGSFDDFRISASANLLSARSMMQIPISGKASWLVSFRRSYLDIFGGNLYGNAYYPLLPLQNGDTRGGNFDNQAGVNTPGFQYYDLNSKLTYAATQNDVLSFSFYNGGDTRDEFRDLTQLQGGRQMSADMNKPQSQWHLEKQSNIGGSGKWTRIWSDRFYSTFLTASSKYDLSYNGDLKIQNPDSSWKESATQSNLIRETVARLDNEVYLDAFNRFEFGAAFTQTKVEADAESSLENYHLGLNNRADQAALYFQNTWSPDERFSLTSGFRTTWYALTENTYIEPRFSFKWRLQKRLTFSGAWGKYRQFVKQVGQDNSLTGGRTGFWALTDQNMKPEFSEHNILGLTWENRNYVFSIEAYRKRLDNLTELWIPKTQQRNQKREAFLIEGDGSSKGLQFLLQRKIGRFSGWAGYTLAKVNYQFQQINAGQSFAAPQDRRHEIKLIGQYEIKKWKLSSTWVYASGAPYTPMNSQQGQGPAAEFFRGSKNSARLPNTHRLDLGVSRSFSGSRFGYNVGLSIYNFYNNSNVWDRTYIPSGRNTILHDVTTLGFTPSFDISVNFN